MGFYIQSIFIEVKSNKYQQLSSKTASWPKSKNKKSSQESKIQRQSWATLLGEKKKRSIYNDLEGTGLASREASRQGEAYGVSYVPTQD